MNRDNDILQKAFLASAASQQPLNRKRCPSLETIAGSFEPRASKRTKKLIVDHLSKCSCCREEFRFYHDLQQLHRTLHQSEGEGSFIDSLDIPSEAGHPNTRPLWSYASILLGLALISSVLLLFFQSTDISVIQRNQSTVVLLTYPLSSHDISEELTFRWKELPSAKEYVLELFDESLLPLWTSPRIQSLQFRLPPELNQKIAAGRRYYWMITAYSGPVKTGESKLTQFVVLNK